MNFSDLCKIVEDDLLKKIEKHSALGIFSSQRAKFEGWLKVELCESLIRYNHNNISPEKGRIDVVVENWAIELKTLNTNYRYSGAENKHRPITKNVMGVIEDIIALNRTQYPYKAVLFVVFTLEYNKEEWQIHLSKIRQHLNDLVNYSFKFINGLPGVLYVGDLS